jgi:hypothetical protein
MVKETISNARRDRRKLGIASVFGKKSARCDTTATAKPGAMHALAAAIAYAQAKGTAMT